MNQAKHAYGNSENLMRAVENGSVDAYDILFLDGDTDPKIGWVDKNGEVKIVKNGGNQIVRVDELPTSNGDANVMYVYNNQCYMWDGNKCVLVSSSVESEEAQEIIETKVEEKLAESAITNEDIENLFKTSEGNKETI